MKKRLIVAILALVSFIILTNPVSSILSLSLASNCSLQNMQSLWEGVFKESYTDITTKNLSSCNFESIKYTDSSGYDKAWFINFFNIPNTNRSYIDYGYYEITDPSDNITLNASDYRAYTVANFAGGYLFSYLRRIPKNRTSPIDTLQKAIDEANIYFNFDSSSPIKWTETSSSFSFGEMTPGDRLNADGLNIYKNLTKNEGQLSRNLTILNPSSCTPLWTAYNTTCATNDKLTQYFTDSRSCGNAPPANQTFTCDYNQNGVMGNLTNTSSISSLTVYINSSTNLTRAMSGTQKVELKTSDYTLVEFNWDFSQALDLDKIYLERQSSSESRGYLIVKGILVNKTIKFQRLTNSTKICARNAEINSIGDMTTNCTGSSEILLDCPDSYAGISCSINENYFSVSGLTSSAVKEVATSTGSCAANWNCSAWTSCIGGLQTKNCTDINRCNSNMLRKTDIQACLPPTPACTPNWLCGNWTACSTEGTKARICADKKSCDLTSDNKKTETSDCEYKKPTNITLWVVVGVISVIIIIVIILIIYFLKKKPEEYTQIQPPVTQYGYSSQQENRGL